MSSKSLRWDQRNGSNQIKSTVDLDGTVRNVATASRKLTTSMKVGLTTNRIPCESRLKPLVETKYKAVDVRRLPRCSAPVAQQLCEAEHMHHAEFKAQYYEHPTPRYGVPFQKFKVWYTGKDGVQRYDLCRQPKLSYRKRDAVTIDRVNSGERPSMNLEVGSIYLKTDPCTGTRTMVNRKVAIVTRDEKQAQRLAHAASKRARRERKKAFDARNRARKAKLKFKKKLNERLNLEELERLQRQLERNTAGSRPMGQASGARGNSRVASAPWARVDPALEVMATSGMPKRRV